MERSINVVTVCSGSESQFYQSVAVKLVLQCSLCLSHGATVASSEISGNLSDIKFHKISNIFPTTFRLSRNFNKFVAEFVSLCMF